MTNDAEETPQTQSDAKISEPAANSDLENDKLKLEVRLLSRQLSKRWLALEWLKSATVLVALIGVGVTLWAGYGQVKQAEQNRISERLDKALTRLASDKPNERITGVSSLRLFLNEEDRSLRAQALNFLVDAASVETDQLVQSAILDVFVDLKRSQISQADIDALLKTVVERNRSLANSIRSEWPKRVLKEKKQKLAGFTRLNLKLDQIPDEIPSKLLSQLTLEEYLDFLETEHGRFERLAPEREVPLAGVSSLITTLLKLGAKTDNFSLIACQRCDFSVARDLSGANFDKANLEHANFSRVILKNTSFHEANLSDTIFFAADLSNSNLRDNTLDVDWNDITHGLPLFECANLKGADLTGTPLLVYREDFFALFGDESWEGVIAPRMLSTQIDKTTNLEYFTVVFVTRVSDAYLIKHSTDARFSNLLKKGTADSEDPLLQYAFKPCEYRRDSANDRDEGFDGYGSRTTCIQLITVDSRRILYLRPQLLTRLAGFLDQPALDNVPLLAAFNRAVGPPQKQYWKSVGEYACDQIAPPPAYKLKIKYR